MMQRVLLIGAGGVGTPAALALGRAGGVRVRVVDDDEVDLTNLHRQILYTDQDVGRPKIEALKAALEASCPGVEVETVAGRFLPENAAEMLRGVDLVVEGCDNFATRFISAEACGLAGLPVVHVSALHWRET